MSDAHLHMSDEFHEGVDGFWHPKCICGWEGPPCPDAETCVDWLMEHAGVDALAEQTKQEDRDG